MEHQVINFDDYRGDKLKLARMAVGLSCEELADKIGKTKQFVSKMEKGFKPSEQVLELIASALNISPYFMYSERKYALESDVCHFRSKKTRTQTLTNSVLARAEILNIILSAVEEEIVFPDVRIPEFPGAELKNSNDIERVAEECRRVWNLGLGPISSMAKLAESVGVIVAHVTGVDDKVDAFTVHNNRPIIIRNNAKKSVCRFRSDIGHEMGHLVMHEGIITGDKSTEFQADRFSSALLVPRLSFIKEFPRIKGKQFDWNALVAFKLRWKISLKMCIFRATSLGLLTQEQARTGYIHLNSKGYTKVEPGDELLKPEEPSIFSSAIDMLDDPTWLKILTKTGVSQVLIRDLFSVSRPLTNPKPSLRLVQ